MKLIVRTTLRNALNAVPAPVMAWMIDSGLIEEFPFELTRRGKMSVSLSFQRGASVPRRYRPKHEITGSFHR